VIGGVVAAGGITIVLISRSNTPSADEMIRSPRTAFIPLDDGGILTFESTWP
jgi:hypothetical protein